MPFTNIDDVRIEYQRIAAHDAALPTIVMLHEGLGSVAMWKDFPQQVAEVTGHGVLVYSRQGYGQSSPLARPRAVRYMHDEALHVLPRLLDALAIDNPILLGHSDGASIALIHAGGSHRRVAALILLAPHVMVEDLSVRSIAAARHTFDSTDLRERLARYHEDVDSTFRGWNDIWLHPEFRCWNIEEYLPAITCPLLAVQGEQDEYGTMEQIERIARVVPATQLLRLANCRHSPHRDCPEALLQAIARFTAGVVKSLHRDDPHPSG